MYGSVCIGLENQRPEGLVIVKATRYAYIQTAITQSKPRRKALSDKIIQTYTRTYVPQSTFSKCQPQKIVLAL